MARRRDAVRIAEPAVAAAWTPARARHGAAPGRRDRALPQLRRRGPARRPRGRRPHRARGERAGRRLSRLAQAHHRSPARRRADAALARMAVPRRGSDRHDRSRDPAAGHAGREDPRDGVGRGHRALPSRRGRTGAVRAPARRADRGVRRRLPRLARRRTPDRRDGVARAPRIPLARRADRRRARARRAGGARRRRAPDPRRVHRIAALRRDAGRARRRRHRRRAVRSGRARAAPARLLLVAPEGVRVHGLGPAGRRAGPAPPAGDSRRGGEGEAGVLYDGAAPGALAAALDTMADADARHRMGAAARTRAERHFSWAAHCRTLDAAITAMRATTPAHAG